LKVFTSGLRARCICLRLYPLFLKVVFTHRGGSHCHTDPWPCAPRLQERPVYWKGGDVTQDSGTGLCGWVSGRLYGPRSHPVSYIYINVQERKVAIWVCCCRLLYVLLKKARSRHQPMCYWWSGTGTLQPKKRCEKKVQTKISYLFRRNL
jgi:hypothetical protein